MKVNVQHNPEKMRFEADLEGQLAMVEYQLAGSKIIFTHTEVPPAHQGQGVANQLAKVALDFAQTEGLEVKALCPFIKRYMEKHP